MKFYCYRLNKENYLVELPSQNIRTILSDKSALSWVHAEDLEPEESDILLAPLNLHPLIVERWNEPGRNARIASFGKVFHLDLPTYMEEESLRPPYLSIIATPELLLTMSFQPVPVLRALAEEHMEDTPFPTAGVSAILYDIIDEMVERNMLKALNLRDEVDGLSSTMIKGFDQVELIEILSFKRTVSRLSALCEDLLHCISSLQTSEATSFAIEGYREYFRDLTGHMEKALQILDRQESRLKDLHLHYNLTLQDRTENRLRILTILSAVFLPLYLITGIYGMNFEIMPELHFKYGYPAILSVMAVLLISLLLYLKKSGWFS